MTITLNVSPELEQRLLQAAEQQGLSLDEYTLQLLDRYLPIEDRRSKGIALLQSWLDEEDPTEQRETGEYLIKTLDEDRLSDRPLFPTEMKGLSW
jgi:hypothetical protein